MELELSDIRVHLKKDLPKSPIRKDVSPAIKGVQPRMGQSMGRGGSIPRRTEPQQPEIIDKIRHMEDAMRKFKSSLLKREQVIATLVTSATEGNVLAQKVADSAEYFASTEKHQYLRPQSRGLEGDDETDTKPVLHRRVQELQKLNNELLAELRATNKKLMDAKFEKDRMVEKMHSSTGVASEPMKAWKTVGQGFFAPPPSKPAERRGYSQPREPEWEIEKRELKAKLTVLSKELDKTAQNQDRKFLEAKAEYRKKLDAYSGKLSTASSCVSKFLSAMQKLQVGVMKRDDLNMERLRKDFEAQKAQLVQLSRDLRVFDESFNKEPLKKVNLSFTRESPSSSSSAKTSTGKSGATLESKRKLEEEVETLKKEHEKVRLEKAQLEALVETLKRTNVARPQSAKKMEETSATAANYEKLIGEYKKSETTLKKRVTDLDSALKKKEWEILSLKKKSTATLKPKIMTLVKKIEKGMLTNLSTLDHKVTVQTEGLGRLKDLLAEKLLALEKEFNNACQMGEKSREECDLRAKHISDLEQRMNNLRNSMQQQYQANEKENKVLKAKVKEMEECIAGYKEAAQKATAQINSKDMLLKRNKERVEDLNKKLQEANTKIEMLELNVAEFTQSSARKANNAPLLESLKKQFIETVNSYKQNAETKLDKFELKLKKVKLSLSKLSDSQKLQYKKEFSELANASSHKSKELLLEFVARFQEKLTKEKEKLLDLLNEQEDKICSLEGTVYTFQDQYVELNKAKKKKEDAVDKLKKEHEILVQSLSFKLEDKEEQLEFLKTNLAMTKSNARTTVLEVVGSIDKQVCKMLLGINETVSNVLQKKCTLENAIHKLEERYVNLHNAKKDIQLKADRRIIDIQEELAEKEALIQEMTIAEESLRTQYESQLNAEQTGKEKELKNINADFSKKLNESQTKCTKLERENRELLEGIKKEQMKVNALNAQLCKTKEVTKNTADTLNSRLSKMLLFLEQSLKKAMAKQEVILAILPKKHVDLKKAQQKMEAVKSQLAISRTECSTLASKNQALLTELAKEQEATRSTESELKQIIDKQKEVIKHVKANVGAKINEIIADVNGKVKEIVKQQCERVVLLQNKMKTLSELYKEREAYSKTKHKKQVDRIKAENEEKVIKLNKNMESLESQLKSFKTESEELLAKLMQERTRFESLKADLVSTQGKVKGGYLDSIERISTRISEISYSNHNAVVNEIGKQETKLSLIADVLEKLKQSHTKTKEKLKAENKSLEQNLVEKEDLIEEMETAQTGLKEQVSYYEAENKKLSTELTEARERVNVLKSALSSARTKLTERVEEIQTSLQEKMLDQNKKVDSIKSEIQKVKSSFECSRIRHNKELEDVNVKLNEKAGKITELEGKLVSFQAESDELVQKYKELLIKEEEKVACLKTGLNSIQTKAAKSFTDLSEAYKKVMSGQKDKLITLINASALLQEKHDNLTRIRVSEKLNTKNALSHLKDTANKLFGHTKQVFEQSFSKQFAAIAALQQQIVILSSQQKSAKGKLAQLIKEVEEKKEIVKGQNERMQQKEAAFKEQISKKNNELSDLQGNLKDQKAQITKLSADVQKYAAIAGGDAEKAKTISMLQGALQEQEAKYQEKVYRLEVQLEEMKENKANALNIIKEKVREFEEKILGMNKAIAYKNDSWGTRFADIWKKVQTLQSKLNESQNKKIADAKVSLADSAKAFADTTYVRIKETKSKVLAHTESIKRMAELTLDVKAKNITLNEKVITLEAELFKSREASEFQSAKNQEFIKKLTKEKEDSVQQSKAQLTALAKVIEKMQSKNSTTFIRIEDEVTKRVECIGELCIKLETLADKSVQHKKHSAAMDEEIKKTTGLVKELKEENTSLQAQLNEKISIVASLESDKASALTEVEQLKDQLSSLTITLQEKDDELLQSQTDINKLTKKMMEGCKAVANYKQRMKVSIGEIRSQFKQNKQWLTQILSTVGTVQKKSAEAISNLKVKIKEKVKTRERQFMKLMAAATDKHEAEKVGLRTDTKLAQEKVKNLEKKIEELQTEIDITKEDLQEGKDAMQEISRKLLVVQDEKFKLVEELEKKAEEIKELEKGKVKTEDTEKKLFESHAKISELTTLLAYEKEKSEEHSRKVSQVQETVGKAVTEKDAANKKLKEMVGEQKRVKEVLINFKTTLLSAFEAILQKYNEKVEGLQERLVDATHELYKIQTDLDDSRNKRKKALSTLRQKVLTLLAAKLDALSSTIDSSSEALNKALPAQTLGKVKELIRVYSERLSKIQSDSQTLNANNNSLIERLNQAQTKLDEITAENSALKAASSKLTQERDEQRQANNELTSKIVSLQLKLTDIEETKSNATSEDRSRASPAAVMGLSKKLIKKESGDEASPQEVKSVVNFSARKSSASSVNTCPLPSGAFKNKIPEELESHVAEHIKKLTMQCLEKVPIEQFAMLLQNCSLVKDFDRLLVPLCSMMGMTPEEQKKLYERRKGAKVDPPTKKKSSGGFFSMFGKQQFYVKGNTNLLWLICSSHMCELCDYLYKIIVIRHYLSIQTYVLLYYFILSFVLLNFLYCRNLLSKLSIFSKARSRFSWRFLGTSTSMFTSFKDSMVFQPSFISIQILFSPPTSSSKAIIRLILPEFISRTSLVLHIFIPSVLSCSNFSSKLAKIFIAVVGESLPWSKAFETQKITLTNNSETRYTIIEQTPLQQFAVV
eukprot:TRINITY_DN143_c0_g1_i3.p1 TRINITY_DN143_c0_g1~~TRINITY_DN143_c0_g1_i3.p1  ORF type:complete len:2692 (-),score=482.76 TRINITY_DN143_c0_g1_i3:13202-21277(-)